MVVTDGGSKRFDLGAMEVWLWFRKQRREDSFWRELCNRPAAELIEAARKAQGQLSFWTRANLDWNAPEAEAIHKALVKICEGCDELSELAEQHFPHLGRE